MTISTIEEIIRVHGKARPNAPICTFDGETLTWGEMATRSTRVANGLRELGIREGTRVALISKNSEVFFEVLFGARKIGAVQVAVNWRLSADEMHYIVADSGAEVLFVESGFSDIADAIAPRLPEVRKVIVIGRDYASWRDQQMTAEPAYSSGPEDVALQLYTSGTTGRPKGAMLMNRSLFSFIRAAEKGIGASKESVHLNCLPLFHVGGINWSLFAFAQGGHVIAFKDFDADTLISEIARSRVTHLMTVPAVIQLLLSRPLVRTTDVSSLQVIVYGGSSISEKALRDAISVFGNTLHGMYGSTELSFGATILTPAEHVDPAHPEWLRSCGRPLEGSTIRVVDPVTQADVGDGVTGEIWFRSAQAGLGYWKQPEATAEKFRSDGWYRTGDLGHQVNGYIFLTDRLNDMIISGGENVYPAEIERVLSDHADVADVAAFSVPDDKWGEAVHAAVVRVPNSTVSGEELVAYAKERLAKYKVPKAIEFTEALPRNASGKVLRQVLRAPHWEGHTRRIS